MALAPGAGTACFSLNRVGVTCLTAITAAALTLPMTWAALTRTPGVRRRSLPIQAFRKAPIRVFRTVVRKADTRAQVEVICAFLSFGFAIATGVLIALHFDKATTGELTCTYIAGGVFEIVGILVTVTQLQISWAGTDLTGRWAKLRGPTVLICGILLGLLATIAWLHIPSPASPPPVCANADAVQLRQRIATCACAHVAKSSRAGGAGAGARGFSPRNVRCACDRVIHCHSKPVVHA